MWRILRVQAYGFVGVVLAGIFFSAYSVSVTTQGRTVDPRLKDFNEILHTRMRDFRSRGGAGMQEPRGQRSSINTAEGAMDSQIRKMEGMTERMQQRAMEVNGRGGRPGEQRQQGSQQDNMSPTSGSWSDDSRPTSDSGLLSDEQTRTRERRQQADYESSPTENRDSTFDMDKVTSQPQGFDDMSPQAPAQPQKQYPAGSAWERLRREAAGANQSSSKGAGRTAGWGGVQREQQREQQQGSTLGDSFAFSSSDEERELAKTEAQSDFDERVEKERRGGDFNEGRGGKRW